MKCPICKADLNPLDIVSRTEHVDLCIENGPSLVDYNETGQLVVKKNIPLAKQRKICPICDKTFQSIHSHFKTCALKFDVPPSLMLEHWDRINEGIKNPKKFPRDLLDNFVAKSVREGRVGDQVDFARALSLSMAEDGSDIQSSNSTQATTQQSLPTPAGTLETIIGDESSLPLSIQDQSTPNDPQPESSVGRPTTDASRILMQNAPSTITGPSRAKPTVPKVRYPLELVDEPTKLSNIELRVDRELAATRLKRYEEALKASRPFSSDDNDDDDDECILLDDNKDIGELTRQPETSSGFDFRQRLDYDKMFYKARLKACDGSSSCLLGECNGHELDLLIEGFEIYIGRSVNAPRPPDREQPNPFPSTSTDCDNKCPSPSSDPATAQPADCSDSRGLANIDVDKTTNDDGDDDDDDNIGSPSMGVFSPPSESC